MNSHFLKVSLQVTQTPLVAVVTLVEGFVLLEGLRLLVDAVVRQVRVQVFACRHFLLVVRLRSKPGKTLVVDVDPKRVDTGQKHINPEVELVLVDEKWVRNVLAHYRLVVVDLQVTQFINDIDTTSLRRLRRFVNPNVVVIAVSSFLL